jgi:hypothetical protein
VYNLGHTQDFFLPCSPEAVRGQVTILRPAGRQRPNMSPPLDRPITKCWPKVTLIRSAGGNRVEPILPYNVTLVRKRKLGRFFDLGSTRSEVLFGTDEIDLFALT